MQKLDILLVVDECFLDFVKEPEEYSLKHSLSGFNNLFYPESIYKKDMPWPVCGWAMAFVLTES